MCLIHSIMKEILPEVFLLTSSMLPARMLMKRKSSIQKRKKSRLEQPYSTASEEVTKIYPLLITALQKTYLTA